MKSRSLDLRNGNIQPVGPRIVAMNTQLVQERATPIIRVKDSKCSKGLLAVMAMDMGRGATNAVVKIGTSSTKIEPPQLAQTPTPHFLPSSRHHSHHRAPTRHVPPSPFCKLRLREHDAVQSNLIGATQGEHMSLGGRGVTVTTLLHVYFAT